MILNRHLFERFRWELSLKMDMNWRKLTQKKHPDGKGEETVRRQKWTARLLLCPSIRAPLGFSMFPVDAGMRQADTELWRSLFKHLQITLVNSPCSWMEVSGLNNRSLYWWTLYPQVSFYHHFFRWSLVNLIVRVFYCSVFQACPNLVIPLPQSAKQLGW